MVYIELIMLYAYIYILNLVDQFVNQKTLDLGSTNFTEGHHRSVTHLSYCRLPGLVNVYIANWKITIFNGKIYYEWPFSIATLNFLGKSQAFFIGRLPVFSFGFIPRGSASSNGAVQRMWILSFEKCMVLDG